MSFPIRSLFSTSIARLRSKRRPLSLHADGALTATRTIATGTHRIAAKSLLSGRAGRHSASPASPRGRPAVGSPGGFVRVRRETRRHAAGVHRRDPRCRWHRARSSRRIAWNAGATGARLARARGGGSAHTKPGSHPRRAWAYRMAVSVPRASTRRGRGERSAPQLWAA